MKNFKFAVSAVSILLFALPVGAQQTTEHVNDTTVRVTVTVPADNHPTTTTTTTTQPKTVRVIAPESVVDRARNAKGPKPAPTGYATLWNGGYEKSDWEIGAGYVNKSWLCTYPSGVTQREDFFGDPTEQYLHGFQFGGLYTPSFSWGLGLRTGLFFEVYISQAQWLRSWCNSFNEVDMYIPLHASYRIPFTSDIALDFFGGMAFQWAMNGYYSRWTGTSWSWCGRVKRYYDTRSQEYGDGWPDRINWQAEVGAHLRLKVVAISFTYSFGVNNHSIDNSFDGGVTYERAIKAREDKMQVTLSLTM